jgi:hypothetical protein
MPRITLTRPATGRDVVAVSPKRLPQRLKVEGRPHGLAPGELVKLHHSLAEALNGVGGVVQFVAAEGDAGTEDVVYDLAYISAAWLGNRVLFINGSGMRLDAEDHEAPGRREPLVDIDYDLEGVENTITRVIGLDLYQMNMPSMRGALDLAPTMKQLPEFLIRLRETFDLVVIAAPAANDAPMGVLLSRFVDGNILVLEAGRTRAPVALELRNSLSASGGIVLGSVLTGYQDPAPRWLRRWL